MIDHWRPLTRPQERFLALPDSIKEGFFGGSAGPGKSELLMMYHIAREFYKHPRYKGLFTRRTYKELKLEIIPRTKELYTAFGGKFNKQDLCWDFGPNCGGGLIFFGHIEHEDDVHNYDSMEINLWTPDEIQSLKEFMYLYIGFTRVRSSIPELPAIIRAAGMPGDIGHTWVRTRFIKPAPKGDKLIIGKGNSKRIFIFSTLADLKDKIPTLQKYSDELEVLPEAEKRAKKYGDWNSYEGQVFEEFRDKHYPGEPENALHVIASFAIPDWWPKIVVIDWGYSAYNYVSYTAISPSKRAYVYREQAWKRTKIEEWAPYVKEFVEQESPRIIKVCKSAGQDRGQEHTIQQQIEEALNHSVVLTNNSPGSRIAGKLLLHEYFRWQQKYVPKNEKEVYNHEMALWLLRNKGELSYKEYLTRFAEQSLVEENIPKLQIFDKSPEGKPIVLLPEAIKACTYDKNNVEDIAEFDGDDPIDNIRYVVDEVDHYFNEAVSELESIQKREELVKEFESTQDWNRLFRKAMAIEGQNNLIKPISRYHH